MDMQFLTEQELKLFTEKFRIVERVTEVIEYNIISNHDVLHSINDTGSITDFSSELLDTDYENSDGSYFIENMKTNETVYEFYDPSDMEEIKAAIQRIVTKDLQKSIESHTNSEKAGI